MKEVGLWIDHKKTVIVIGDGDEIVTLKSNMEKHVRFTGRARGKTQSKDYPTISPAKRDNRITDICPLNKKFISNTPNNTSA